MRAMVLEEPGRPLVERELPPPEPAPGQALVTVRACGVCRTDLHVADGDLRDPKLPLVLGHQIVGTVADGDRVGVPWLGWTCGECRYCRSGRENLCDRARFTGYQLDGGFAEYAVADEVPPEQLGAAIIFAPVGELVPAALRVTAKGGTVVCAGIHMSDIPAFPYELLWGERVVRSVANLTRRDGEEFLALAPEIPIRTEIELYRLEQANEALSRLRAGRVRGAAVVSVG